MKNQLVQMILCFVSFSGVSVAVAGPGAHGPNGEHMNVPTTETHAATGMRLEAVSESFEIVGSLQGNELSLVIDRFDTNEPVLGARLEIELEGRKAVASFHADHGDYSVDDAAFLQALSEPGKHAVVMTLAAGGQNDLLEATFEVAPATGAQAAGEGREHAHQGAHAHEYLSRKRLFGGGAVVVLAAVFLLLFVRARRRHREFEK
ncbi:MAG: hypothetical protein V4695_01000 [Pseudomonadota bacterium]